MRVYLSDRNENYSLVVWLPRRMGAKMKRARKNKIRTIYDKGVEEVGRKQLDLHALGGMPTQLDDGDFDFDDQLEGLRNSNERFEDGLSKQSKLMREKLNQY